MTYSPDFRSICIARARSLYIPRVTLNLSVALSLYLNSDNFTGDPVPLRISGIDKPRIWIDDIDHPDCPVCSNVLLLRSVYTPIGRSNINGWKTCWECLSCGYERYSLKSIQDRLNTLYSKPRHRS